MTDPPKQRESRPEETPEAATRLTTAIPSLTADDAYLLDGQIRLLSATIGKDLTRLTGLIRQARDGEIHLVLGHRSWTAYLASALSQLDIGMHTPARRELVALLSDEGMSNRAIAQAVGVTEGTVRNDKVRNDYAPAKPEPQPKHRPTRSPKLERRREWSAAGGWRTEADKADTNVSTPATAPKNNGGNVFGLDGKVYTPKPQSDPKPPAPPRRRPISDAFGDYARKITAATGSLERLCEDSRFSSNTDSLTRYLTDLVRARQALDRTIARFDGTDLGRRIGADQIPPDVVDAERVKYRADCDAQVAAYKAELDAKAARFNAMRDEERQRYQLGIEAQRARGVIALRDFNTILSCLHPDSRMSSSDEKLAEAFRLFNSPVVKVLIVKEIDSQ